MLKLDDFMVVIRILHWDVFFVKLRFPRDLAIAEALYYLFGFASSLCSPSYGDYWKHAIAIHTQAILSL